MRLPRNLFKKIIIALPSPIFQSTQDRFLEVKPVFVKIHDFAGRCKCLSFEEGVEFAFAQQLSQRQCRETLLSPGSLLSVLNISTSIDKIISSKRFHHQYVKKLYIGDPPAGITILSAGFF
jgi:hypothetical protein